MINKKLVARTIQTESESRFFEVLQSAFPEHHVAVQVSMSAIVEAVEYKDRSQFRSSYVDFVICDKKAMFPLVVVELDDWSHDMEKSIIRDTKKNTIFLDAGIPLYRYRGDTPDVLTLQKNIRPLIVGQSSIKVTRPTFIKRKRGSGKKFDIARFLAILGGLIAFWLVMYFRGK